MTEFLAAVLSFPTLIFTVLLVFVLLYWGLVLLGALDIELFDLDADVGDVDLDLDLGGGELDVGGEVGGEVDGDVDLDGDSDAPSGLFSTLGLAGVPITMTVSLVVFLAWAISLVATVAIGDATDGMGLLGSLLWAGIGLGSVVAAFPVAALALRPFKGSFVVHQAPRRSSLLGRTCTIATLRVTGTHGQAEIDDGGAGLLIQVRCPRENHLTKGAEAVLYEYDEELEAFLVAPLDRKGPSQASSGASVHAEPRPSAALEEPPAGGLIQGSE